MARTTVPMEYVKKGEIVLNISFGATSGLKMDNDAIHFHARFGGVSREIYVPVHNVLAIYANENGQGMAFEVGASPAAIAATGRRQKRRRASVASAGGGAVQARDSPAVPDRTCRACAGRR